MIFSQKIFLSLLYSFLQENDEFFELLSSKFLSESRYSISIRAAAARVLLGCSLSWMVKNQIFLLKLAPLLHAAHGCFNLLTSSDFLAVPSCF